MPRLNRGYAESKEAFRARRDARKAQYIDIARRALQEAKVEYQTLTEGVLIIPCGETQTIHYTPADGKWIVMRWDDPSERTISVFQNYGLNKLLLYIQGDN